MREAVTKNDKINPVGEGFMDVLGMGQVHKKHTKFTNMQIQDEARSGLDILSRGHVVSRDTEMTGVEYSSGVAEAGDRNGNMRLGPILGTGEMREEF